MVARFPTAIALAPLVMLSFPADELRLLSAAICAVAAVMLATLVAREMAKDQRILVLGAGAMASQLIEEIEAVRPRRYIVAGVVDDTPPPPGSAVSARWLGRCDRLAEIVAQVQPARIVVAVADRRERLPLESLLESRVRGIVVEDALDFYEQLTGKIAIEALRPSMLFLSKGFRNHGAAQVTARVVSVMVAAIGLVLLLPLLMAIAVAVTLDSRGPVFFIQQRASQAGRPFGLVKFRTMHPCDEPPSEWVLDNVTRITRLGRYLRRFRLDELPQVVNVLRGEMNLIGPRPHPTRNHAFFMEQIAYYGLRSTVRPGVTGWAQVRYGYANNLEEETEKMRYDLYYIKNRSLWLDVRILLETVGIVLFGKGASVARRPSPLRDEMPRRAVARRPVSGVAYVAVESGSSPAQNPVARSA
ncbi:MAG TPA: exopolysaccharide biosynthesis polyprenyl glycosylphosphotransferase [Vicinamibacterales bacterium]